MKRILIVDDEPRQRRGLARLVSSLHPDWMVTEAANGQDALHIAQEERPDAVLSDIRMPVVDGFELGERLQAILPDIVIAYVSAYEDFQYAAKALRLGAVEYLLKPYTSEQLEQTLQQLDRRVAQRRKTDEVSQQLGITMDAWREQHLLALLTRALTIEEIADVKRFLPVDCEGYVLQVRILDDGTGEWTAEDGQESIAQLKGWLTARLPELRCCALPAEPARLMGLLPSALPPEELEARLEAILREGLDACPVRVLIGISNPMRTIAEDAQKAYRQASLAAGFAFYQPQGGLVTYHSVQKAYEHELPYLFRYEQRLQQKLQEASREGLQELLDGMFDYINAQMCYPPDKLLRRLYQMYQSMLGGVEGRLSQGAFERLWADGSAVFSELTTYDQLREDFLHLMLSVIDEQSMDRSEHAEEHIRACIAYIQQCFAQQLCLCELGDRFYFSPNYLSALIKSRTGLPFKQYLQSLRLDAALERLRTSEGKVADIAQAVGFVDPAYFNRIFKKKYGVSPDNYRRGVKGKMSGVKLP